MCAMGKDRRRGAMIAVLGGTSSSLVTLSHAARHHQTGQGLIVPDLLFAGGIILMLAAVVTLCFSLRQRR